MVCFCKKINYSQIVEAIHQGSDTIEKISEKIGAGTGCSTCIEEVQEILAEQLSEQ